VSADRADAGRAKLNKAMAVTAAESVVTSARMADLVEAQRAARAQHSAAQGLLTKALKDGSAEKIAALQAREAAAYHEADRIGREAIEEMLALNGARWRSPNGTAGR
jgi:1,6-anhydro-N-acetylmuramate kinase